MLRGAHVQTIFGSLPAFGLERDERVLIPLGDGDCILAHASWRGGAEPRDLYLLVHGAGGSSESGYVRRWGRALAARGAHVVRLDLRGAGEGVHHARSIYHAGQIDDLDRAVRHFVGDRRAARVFLVGFSLGGSQLLKLAGAWGDAAPRAIAGIATLSAPTDFPAVSTVLDATFAYRRLILGGVVRQALRFARVHRGRAPFDPRRVRAARTIREYDELVMVPMHRFRDIEHYYVSTSAKHALPAIRVPTLLLHAADDPIIPAHTVAASVRAASRAVEVAWTDHGGHVGWIGGLGAEPWALDQMLAHFAARS